MKPIIKWTLWQRKVSTFWWCIGLALFMFVNMIFYPSFKEDADQLQQSFDNIPDAALQLLGGSSDFFSPIGYVNSQIFFLTLPIALAILAISLGSKLLAQEETDTTLESILARPISRSRLLAAKSLGGSIILTVVTIVSWISIVVLAQIVDLNVPIWILTQATIVCWLLVYTFGAIAFMLTAIGRTKGISVAVASFMAFGGYIISSLAGTVEWLQWPAKIFPFYYYQSEAILRGEYRWSLLAYFIVVIVLCATVSWAAFRRRDLR
jgi:ABC-2 type transport system permease protein